MNYRHVNAQFHLWALEFRTLEPQKSSTSSRMVLFEGHFLD